jgi:hypothetical protein
LISVAAYWRSRQYGLPHLTRHVSVVICLLTFLQNY